MRNINSNFPPQSHSASKVAADQIFNVTYLAVICDTPPSYFFFTVVVGPTTSEPPLRGSSVSSKRKSWLFAFRSLFFPPWTSVSSSTRPYAIYCPCTGLGISAYMTEWALTRYWPPLGWLWLERLIRKQGAASSLLTLRLNYSNITLLVYLWYSF